MFNGFTYNVSPFPQLTVLSSWCSERWGVVLSVVIQCYTTDHRVIQPHYGLYLVLYSSSLYQDQPSRAISGQQNGKLSTETMSPNSYSQKNNNEVLFAHQPQFNKSKKVCVFIRAAKQRFENISQSQRRPLYYGLLTLCIYRVSQKQGQNDL